MFEARKSRLFESPTPQGNKGDENGAEFLMNEYGLVHFLDFLTPQINITPGKAVSYRFPGSNGGWALMG